MAITLTGANRQVCIHTVGTADAFTCRATIRSTMPDGGGSFYSPGIGMTLNIERGRNRKAGRLSNVLMCVVIACVVMALEYVVNY